MNERAGREKEQYNKSFDEERSQYGKRFGHANSGGYYADYTASLIKNIMKDAAQKNVLELGSTSWTRYLDLAGSPPARVTCINISEAELKKGKDILNNINTATEFDFKIMDANSLDFADETFDVVIGGGILHHLDFETALKEVHRVLKKGGFCLFEEPLGCNPIGRYVRKRTPSARTVDEKPLEKNEILLLNKLFNAKCTFFQLFYVPAGVISNKLFKTPYNILMKSAFHVDRFLAKVMPLAVRLQFRYVMIYLSKK